MSSSGIYDPVERIDDLAVARRAYSLAREELMRLEHQVRLAREDIEHVSHSLGTDIESDIRKRLTGVWEELCGSPSARGTRINGEVHTSAFVSWETHNFLGLWRPPAPPQSPQELGCAAIICACRTDLRNAAQVRQHWETGCFDLPNYETTVRRDLDTILDEIKKEMLAEDEEKMRDESKEDD
jgi:hypothetical protein